MVTENQTIRRICAWCGFHLRGNPKAKTVSHGICIDCALGVINDNLSEPDNKQIDCLWVDIGGEGGGA